jgi:plastocyanin
MGFKKTVGKIAKGVKKVAKIRKEMGKVSKTLRKIDQYTGGTFVPLHAVSETLNNKQIKRIIGNGDYTVQTNSIATLGHKISNGTDVPTFSKGKRFLRVHHREYIGDVVSSSSANTFDVNSYTINPGDPVTFPWLSGIASQYDQWQPNGIVFAFKSTSATFNGTDQSLGTVILASDYDTLDATYGSKQEMENSEFAISGASYQSILHPVECNPAERPTKLLYVRKGQQTPADSVKFYDLCNTQVATAGISGTSVNVGELWVTYDISFYKEQLGNGAYGSGILEYAASNTTGIAAATPFGTSANRTIKTSNTLIVTVNATTTITFPTKLQTGSYLFTYYCIGSSGANVAPTVTTFTNCEAGPNLFGSASTIFSPAATSTVVWFQQTIRILRVGASFIVSGGTYPGSPTQCYYSLTQLNPGVSA